MTPAAQLQYIWLDGKVVKRETSTVNITAVGHLATAATVFEGIRAYRNADQEMLYIFRLQEHMKRLANSMKLQWMKTGYSNEYLCNAVVDLLRANNSIVDTYISPRAFFDVTAPWGTFIGEDSPVQILIDAWPRPSRLADGDPISCCVSSWTRISDHAMPPRIKCLSNFQNSLLALGEAVRNGYEGSVMLDDRGKVSEGPTACLFMVREGVIATSKTTNSILESITRETLIELFRDRLGMQVEVREIDRTELYIAEEAFFCGTGGGEITPIAAIDKHPLGTQSPGPLTQEIRAIYHNVVRGNEPQYMHWLTAV